VADTENAQDPVLLERADGIARVTLNRPEVRNAQNGALLISLDDALVAAADDDEVAVVVLRAAGDHFSAGHDIGRTRDADVAFPRRATLQADHMTRAGAERRWARESDLYLGLCRRWRGLPKPTIAAVQGACAGAGLMLTWCCDLIVASEDAYFVDPVVRMGVPGVEFFAHPWALGSRVAKEMLFTGAPVSAERAHAAGMVSRVVPRAELDAAATELAARIAAMPRFGLQLAKYAVNQAEDLMGLDAGITATFALHHLGHSHNVESGDGFIGGMDASAMSAFNKANR
jgi:enoyl-CoA hydratase